MAKLRKHVKISPIFLILILLLGAFGATQLVRAASGGISGSPGTRLDTARATDYVSTTSPDYSLIPNMSVAFITSNQAPAMVTISMSAPVSKLGNYSGCGHYMRLTVDGEVDSEEIPVLLGDLDMRSYSFVTRTLDPGSHTANVEWRIQMPYFAATGCTQSRSLVVLHQ